MNFQSAWLILGLLLLGLGSERTVRGQDIVISELMGANDNTLADEDGEFSDWLELQNLSAVDVELRGWFLSDDAGDPQKWEIPPVTLETGGFLVIFASGKNRTSPEGELHTSFKLSADGEYLGLTRPDGTIAHEYFPAYPRQRPDVSYGLASEVATLVAPGAPVDYHVPFTGDLGARWTREDFAPDAEWSSGTTGIGYQVGGDDTGFPPPLSFWSFEDGLEDSVGSHHGVFEGGGVPRFVDGAGGPGTRALGLDGQAEYVEVTASGGEPLHNSAEYTIAMWVKGLPQADKRVYSEGSSSNNNPLFTIGTDSSGTTGRVDIFIRSDSSRTLLRHALTEGVAFDGSWHHIAWVDRGGSANVFIDGVRDAETFDYEKEALQLNVASVGAVLRSTPCCFFDGAIDDLAVWRTALNDDEIAILASGVAPGEGSGYSPLVETDVRGSMRGLGSSIYLRIPFVVEDMSVFERLTLRMKYDDGFVAYINGQEVARRGAPAAPDWDSTATVEHSGLDAVVYENVDVSSGLDVLGSGENLLAVHGLNVSPDDASFLVLPELVASGMLGTEAQYFAAASPGAANEGGTIDFVADTRFSVDRGFYEDPIVVEITTETEGAEIRYTLDGSAPTAEHGEVYTDSLLIETTTTLRAAAFKEGYQPTDVDTHTYIFLDDVIRQPNARPGYPSSWQGWPADYGMDPEIATDTGSPHYAPTLKDDLKSLPTLSLVLDPDDLMGRRGIYTNSLSRGVNWERAGSAELIFPDGSEEGFSVNCGVRMQGGSSARPGEGKHAFRLLFKREYGPTKLEYELFKDSPADRFDTIVLRCFSTDSWHFKDGGSRYRRWDSQFIRDIWMKDSQLAMGHLSSHNTYVHLYLNGYYWGIYNPSERPDDAFNALYQGGEKEDWDVMKDFNELFRGDRNAWNEFMREAGSVSTNAAYQRIQGRNPDGTRNPDYPALLDVENLIDYMILHLYACSEDWPHHNWYAARNRVDGSQGWKFFVWDQEIVMDFQFRNRVGVSNANSPAYPYSRLRSNPEFRMLFADRVQKHLFAGGALTNEAARRRWMRRAEEIDRAVVAESARWGDYRMDVRDPSNSPAELYTREDHWLVEQEKVIEEYIPRSHALALERFRAGGLYPEVPVPAFSQEGGRIARDFVLSLTAPRGTVYYTLDGTDPRLPGGAISPDALDVGLTERTVLLEEGAPARILVPSDDGSGLDWTRREFDDASWTPATSAVGYERSSGFEDHFSTDVEGSMYETNASIYLRVPFEVEDPAAFTLLSLRMKYDDGFIAYLNGREVASHNAPPSAEWDSRATSSHSDREAEVFVEFDVTAGLDALQSGTNVLAIHGLNASTTSTDFLMVPVLAGGTPSEDSGVPLSATTVVRARTLEGGEWSALQEFTFIIDNPLALRITELNYHPHDPPSDSPHPADDFEFVELQNVSAEPLALLGVKLTGGIEFDFSAEEVLPLAPGEVVLIVKSFEAFRERYDTTGLFIAGEYEGNLANSGEDLALESALGETVLAFSWDDDWYPETDGGGSSLVIADAQADPSTWGEPSSWMASGAVGGTPGFHPIGEEPAGGLQLIGDANQDGDVDVSDAISFLRFLFVGGELTLPCDGGAIDTGGNLTLFDINGDGTLNVSDSVGLLGYLFGAATPPALGTGCVRIEGCPDVCVR